MYRSYAPRSEPGDGDPAAWRSHRWFGADDLRGFGHRSRTLGMGYRRVDFAGRPVIAILSTWSDVNPCHTHFRARARAEDVKRGVLLAGGFPLEIPVMSLSEPIIKPSAMLYRNLLSMEVEEHLRSLPLDGAVLMGGCDKTTPGLVMGAVSADMPFVFLPAGPMLRGNWRGRTLGSGSDTWRYWADRRAGVLPEGAWEEIEEGMARSPGHCMTMGTASTMTALAEAMGLTLPGASAIPAVDSAHNRMAADAGACAVDLVRLGARPSAMLDRRAVDNALAVLMALGGSTNAVIHLIAMAARAGVALTLDDFDAASRCVPVLANLRPAGAWLMEDFWQAGGLPALMAAMGDRLDGSASTVNGRTLGENLAGAAVFDADVIRSPDRPVFPEGGLAILRGNLCPGGALVKHAAVEPHLMRHRGPAIVFPSRADMAARIDRDDLPVTADSVIVLQNAGAVGGPGLPEWGQLPIPRKLLAQGVRDMLRISDARMSGTSYGACVLHVSPESARGGPLALVRDGDVIAIDIPARTLTLEVPEEALAARRAAWTPLPPREARGYGRLYADHVLPPEAGADFDFLQGPAGFTEPEIH